MITLVLGGTRSGKSEVAESLAAAAGGDGPVTYLAAGPSPEGDAEWVARVARHRARRPAGWTTIEAGPGADLAAVVAALEGPLLIESLGTWLAGREDLAADGPGLCAALAGRRGDTVVVSEEVGLGVHPPTAVGRAFADALGALNRTVADAADRVLLVVAGRVLPLDRPG